MDRKLDLLTTTPLLIFGALALASCNDPTADQSTFGATTEIEGEETCGASAEWAGQGKTPAMQLFMPLPHPDAECPFYRGGWHNFLLAGEPDPVTGEPAIKSFPTIDDVFDPVHPLPAGALAAAGQPKGTATRSWLGDIKQAGERKILIDQNGHTIYYGIHVNQGYVDFINRNNLRSAAAVHNAPKNLFFPGGVVEYKTAWQRVDGVDANDPEGWQDKELENYVATTAWVPHITKVGDKIVEDRSHPEKVWVRLLALHSVYTFPGHPEFIWASMEHTDRSPGMPPEIQDVNAGEALELRNVAPLSPTGDNPPDTDKFNAKVAAAAEHPGLLYKDGTPINKANQPFNEADLTVDSGSQVFSTAAGIAETSVYRMFPASKSNTTHPDDAITSLNFNVQTLFDERAAQGLLHPRDKRGNYRLVGGQWLDKPRYFKINSNLQNDSDSPLLQDPVSSTYRENSKGDFQDPDRQAVLDAPEPDKAALDAFNGNKGVLDYARNGGDSAFSITAGEDRMSSTAMESFTQQPGAFQNCFGCHNTQAISSNGVTCDKDLDPNATRLLQPKLLNVSHVLSQFLLEECTGPEPRPAFCNEKCTDPVDP
jgi:hypothetical protein